MSNMIFCRHCGTKLAEMHDIDNIAEYYGQVVETNIACDTICVTVMCSECHYLTSEIYPL